MFKKFLNFFCFLILFLIVFSSLTFSKNISDPCQLNKASRYPLMRPDRQTMLAWIKAYKSSRLFKIDPKKYKIPSTRGSVNLLEHMYYVPSERNQGSCGNCWAWAGTGVMEIALDVEKSVKDRLSVQYLNSCETSVIGKPRCEGGWLTDITSFYSATKKAVPWSNTNAAWEDGDLSYEISCDMVSTTPNYPIKSIVTERITTQEVNQATAIANIKNVLDQGRGVWFAFFLPDDDAWNNFFYFWDTLGENSVYNIDKYNGIPFSSSGAGHAVLCVGYNDTDPNNSYWIMLNSWGTTSSRPNGLFRVNMNMDYSCANYPYYSLYWQTLDIEYGDIYSVFVLFDRTSGSQKATDERIVNFKITPYGETPDQMILSESSSFSGASWQTYSSTGTFTLSQGYGKKTVYLKMKKDSTESAVYSASITYAQNIKPEISSFIVTDQTSGSSSYTNSPDVKVSVNASNADEMIISENSNFSGASWKTYSSSFNFNLSPNDGLKTIYFKVRNVFETQSEVKTAQITLDSTAPVVKIKADDKFIESGDLVKNNFKLYGLFTDLTGIEPNSIKIYIDNSLVTDGSDPSGRYDSYDPVSKIVSYQLKNSFSEGTHSIKITGDDLATNTGQKEITNLRTTSIFKIEDLLNFPNPFSTNTKISYQLSRPADVTIKIFTTKGKLLKTFNISKNSEGGQIGFNYVSWDGTDEAGNLLPNDAYIVLVIANDGTSKISKKGKIAILR